MWSRSSQRGGFVLIVNATITMSANPSYLPDRIDEAVAVASASATLANLQQLCKEPSAKRYAASREQRRTLALDLVNAGQRLVDRLAEPTMQRKPRAVKPVVAKPAPVTSDPQPTIATA